jgi:hypothetical protein
MEINCPNYIICDTTGNKDLFDCYGGTCLNCDVFFSRNKMEIKENIECSICADNELKNGIKNPNCSHVLCVEHMKEYYRNNKIALSETDFDINCELFENSANIHPPEFPYDESIENAYDLGYDSHVDFENDELIIKYQNDLNNYNEIRDNWIENNCYNELLKKCPLCRIEFGFSLSNYKKNHNKN